MKKKNYNYCVKINKYLISVNSALLLFTGNFQGTGHGIALYKGMLPCFFHGFSSFLVDNTSKSRQIRFRVMWGLMMSSTNPVNKQIFIKFIGLLQKRCKLDYLNVDTSESLSAISFKKL